MKLAIEGGCNAVASTFGVLGSVARKYAHKIPFIVKINHNELLTYPNKFDQIMFGKVEQAADMGAAAVGATIYFGSDESGRQIVEVAQAFASRTSWAWRRCCGATCATRSSRQDKDYHVSADLTGQANHLGVTIQADIIKQKLPENNGGYKALNTGSSSYGKLDERMYTQLTTDHPIDLTRYQVANCYMGRAGLINSGGASGKNDFGDAAVDRRDQQARGRHGPHLRAQGLPASDEGRRRAAERHPGRVPGSEHHGRLDAPTLRVPFPTTRKNVAEGAGTPKPRHVMSVAAHLGIRLADYNRRVRTFIPDYEELLAAVADAAAAASVHRRPVVLDLGVGTGALAEACVKRLHPARVVGIDLDPGMLDACRRRLAGLRNLELIHADFSRAALPPCDAIVATLALHHLLTARAKGRFYKQCFEALRPGGLLVSGDCCPSSDPRLASAEREEWVAHLRSSYSAAKTRSYFAAWAGEDRYFPLADELDMLAAAGFRTDVPWRRAPFAVIVARKPSRRSRAS